MCWYTSSSVKLQTSQGEEEGEEKWENIRKILQKKIEELKMEIE